MSGEFTDVWTFAEAARVSFSWQHFAELIYENTSGYLLVACLVSVAAALFSWVAVFRVGPLQPPEDGEPDTRGGDGSASNTPERQECPSALPPPPALSAEEEAAEAEAQEEAVPDLVDMAHHLPSRVKTAQLRSIRERLQRDMSEEQRQQEKRVEQDQMAAIMSLMQQNSDKFGSPTVDDVRSQLRLYM